MSSFHASVLILLHVKAIKALKMQCYTTRSSILGAARQPPPGAPALLVLQDHKMHRQQKETQMAAHTPTGLQIWTNRNWSWKNPHELPKSERNSDSSGRMALVWFWFLQETSEQAQVINSAHHPCVNSWLRAWAATSLGADPAVTLHFSCFQNTLHVSPWVFVLNAPSAGCCVNYCLLIQHLRLHFSCKVVPGLIAKNLFLYFSTALWILQLNFIAPTQCLWERPFSIYTNYYWWLKSLITKRVAPLRSSAFPASLGCLTIKHSSSMLLFLP